MAARRVAARRARRGARPVRHGLCVPPRLRAPPGRRAVRRADDRALLAARADQRPRLPLQADPEGDPPGASGDPADAREPRARRQPVRPAPRLVSGGGVPLPAADGGADRAQGVPAGKCLRAAHRPCADGVPPEHVRCACTTGGSATTTTSLVVDDTELDLGVASREGSSSTRGSAMRCEASRPGRRPRSRSRHSSRTPSTRWRPRFSARRTSCGSNAVSTSSRSACTRSRPDRPPACIARSRGRRDESSAASARWPDEADDLRPPDDPAQRLGLARRPPRRPPLDHGVRGAVPRHGHDRRPPRRNARSALRGHGRPVHVLDLGGAHGKDATGTSAASRARIPSRARSGSS